MGGGGKGGKGGGGQQEVVTEIPGEVLALADRQVELGERLFDIGEPVLAEAAQNALSFLQTGNAQALTPAISQATQQAASQFSAQNTDLQANLARAGVTGSTGQDILAQQQGAQGAALSSIGLDIATPLALNLLGAPTGAATSGLQGVGGGLAGLTGGIRGGITSGGGGGGKKGGGILGGIGQGIGGGIVSGIGG